MSILSSANFTARFSELSEAFYTRVNPQPLNNVFWVAWNGDLAVEYGLPKHANDELLQIFSGQYIPAQFAPLAMKYAGHQFGTYNPDLGDGRGLLLAEIISKNGESADLHLKGAGLTPYSRMGDGRAVLRSSIREYLCSEAMAGLGIATTRALALMGSDTPVYREKQEYGALLVRLATSHIRFGHFEHFFYSNQFAEQKLLADKAIEWYFPQCTKYANPYAMMFQLIVERTALMIAQWQTVGFSHGVMNTDNMSILGQTFDYGPFGFLDDYQPSFICNHSDYQGRYAFNQQPKVALWNLTALAHALSPLIDKVELEKALAHYEAILNHHFSDMMRKKLGLNCRVAGDERIFSLMFQLLAENRVDYTRFFRQLSSLDNMSSQQVIDLFIHRDKAQLWLETYLTRCAQEVDDNGHTISTEQRCREMRKINPKFILRNYLAQIAIDKAEQGDFSEVNRLADILKNPFDEQRQFDDYAKLPPDWGKKLDISCSS